MEVMLKLCYGLFMVLFMGGLLWVFILGFKDGQQKLAEGEENIFRIDKDWNVTLFDVYEKPVAPMQVDVVFKEKKAAVPPKANKSKLNQDLLRECVSFLRGMGINAKDAKLQASKFLKSNPNIKTTEEFIDKFLKEMHKGNK